METIRKPLQGVVNIIRFNWHFYVIAFAFVAFLLVVNFYYLRGHFQVVAYLICFAILGSTLISLLVSLYVYDLSGLYSLAWIKPTNSEKLIVNINAGFDETSALLKEKFENAQLLVFDFYDPKKHTEISIKRARKAYPPYPQTIPISTTDLPLAENSVDAICVIFAAHEIRNEAERTSFLEALHKAMKPDGRIYLTEHLRDVPNFLAYNIGFFHFYSKATWVKLFGKVGLQIAQEMKLTPFISTFILCKNGDTF